MKLTRTTILLIIILVGAAALRFWDLANVVYFEFDDQYNSYLVYDLLKNHHFSPIGQQMSFGGMFLGPWHYLFLVPFYLLTNLHPVGGYIGEAVIGLLIIFSYYWTGARLFNVRTGLLAAFIRSIVFAMIMQDHNIGPAYPSELVGVWFIYFLYRLHQGWKPAFIWLSFLFGMMFTVHLVVLPLVIVAAVSYFLLRPIKPDLRIGGASVVAFFIPVSPQLLFEIKHRFAHLQMLTETLVGEGRTEGDWLAKLWYTISYNVGNFYRYFDSMFLPWWLGFVIFTALIVMILKKHGVFNKPFLRWFFPLTFLTVAIYYLVYPRHVPEYYFMVMAITTVFYLAAFMAEMSVNRWGKPILGVLLVLMIVSNSSLLISAYKNPAKFNLAQKDGAVKTIVDHQRGKGEYSVSYFTEYGRHYGFQYFFTYYGLEPRAQISPPIYSLVLPKSQVADKDLSTSFGDIGVIFPEKEPQQGK